MSARQRTTRAILVAMLASLCTSPTMGEEDAASVVRQMRYRNDGSSATGDVEMVLVDVSGQRSVRRLRAFDKDSGRDTWHMMFVVSPADLRNTGFLTMDYDDPEKDDAQWLYLPAVGQTKRISIKDKSGSFLGSDFSFADFTSLNVVDYDYRIEESTVVDGEAAWAIRSKPRNARAVKQTGISNSLLVIRKKDYVKLREVQWMENGETKYWAARRFLASKGVVVPVEMTMTTKRNEAVLHRTLLRIDNVVIDAPLEEELFSVRRLENGL